MIRKFYFALSAFFILNVITVGVTFAQVTIGIAQYLPIDGNPEESDIISIKDGRFVKSAVEYDSAVVGVVSYNNAISIERATPDEGTYPVIDSGIIRIKVSSVNGVIKKGDVLTTSKIPGVAMKATTEGFSIGLAEEDFLETDASKVQKINVNLRIQYVYEDTGASTIAPKNLVLDSFNVSSLKRYDTMAGVLKLGFAVILVIATFGYGFVTFRKIATRAVEASGRNPLASRMITFNLIINIFVTVLIIGSGLVLSYFILSL